jgi:hypothetical protein
MRNYYRLSKGNIMGLLTQTSNLITSVGHHSRSNTTCCTKSAGLIRRINFRERGGLAIKTFAMLSSTLLLLLFFLFNSNNLLMAECPTSPPGAWEPITYGGPPVTFKINYKGCEITFEVCWTPNKPTWSPVPDPLLNIERMFYISTISIPEDCKLNVPFEYGNIMDACMSQMFNWTSVWIFPSLFPVPLCGDGQLSYFMLGHPSCITDPFKECYYEYTVSGNDKDGYIQIPHKAYRQTFRNCKTSNDKSCWVLYSACWRTPEYWNIIVTRETEYTESFDCPESIKIPSSTFDCIEDPWHVNLPCHPVCGYSAPPSAPPTTIAPSTITNLQVAPNPASNDATLTFEVLEAGDLNIILVNAAGDEMTSIHNAFAPVGEFTKKFSTSNLPVGVYFVRISHNGKVKLEKLVKN